MPWFSFWFVLVRSGEPGPDVLMGPGLMRKRGSETGTHTGNVPGQVATGLLLRAPPLQSGSAPSSPISQSRKRLRNHRNTNWKLCAGNMAKKSGEHVFPILRLKVTDHFAGVCSRASIVIFKATSGDRFVSD